MMGEKEPTFSLSRSSFAFFCISASVRLISLVPLYTNGILKSIPTQFSYLSLLSCCCCCWFLLLLLQQQLLLLLLLLDSHPDSASQPASGVPASSPSLSLYRLPLCRIVGFSSSLTIFLLLPAQPSAQNPQIEFHTCMPIQSIAPSSQLHQNPIGLRVHGKPKQ